MCSSTDGGCKLEPRNILKKVMFEHKHDKRGATEAERWRAAPWDRSRAETGRQRGMTPNTFPIRSVSSASHPSPRTPPPITPFRLSIPLIPHLFPVCLSANALQRGRLGSRQLLSSTPKCRKDALSIPANEPRTLWRQGAGQEQGPGNLWNPHDSPAKSCLLCLCVFSRCVFLYLVGLANDWEKFRPKYRKMEAE